MTIDHSLVLITHLMSEGERRKTLDNLDRLRQRGGKHWDGSRLSLQVVLLDLENIRLYEFFAGRWHRG